MAGARKSSWTVETGEKPFSLEELASLAAYFQTLGLESHVACENHDNGSQRCFVKVSFIHQELQKAQLEAKRISHKTNNAQLSTKNDNSFIFPVSSARDLLTKVNEEKQKKEKAEAEKKQLDEIEQYKQKYRATLLKIKHFPNVLKNNPNVTMLEEYIRHSPKKIDSMATQAAEQAYLALEQLYQQQTALPPKQATQPKGSLGAKKRRRNKDIDESENRNPAASFMPKPAYRQEASGGPDILSGWREKIKDQIKSYRKGSGCCACFFSQRQDNKKEALKEILKLSKQYNAQGKIGAEDRKALIEQVVNKVYYGHEDNDFLSGWFSMSPFFSNKTWELFNDLSHQTLNEILAKRKP